MQVHMIEPALARHGPLRKEQQPALPPAGALAANKTLRGFSVHWAVSESEVREAQQLRYQIFSRELGAILTPLSGTPAGFDADRFDAYCDHLLVRAAVADGQAPGQVIGTYRVLGPAAARRAGGLYAESEFDLSPLHCLRPHAVEFGRSCVHAAWRSGGVIMALWGALAQYMARHELDTMMGCASISMADGGTAARQLWQQLRTTHLAEPRWQVRPYAPLPLQAKTRSPASAGNDLAEMPTPAARQTLQTPPLIKGYLRCGARVLGPPALDAAFNTADLPMMMRIDDLAPRYRRHFLGT